MNENEHVTKPFDWDGTLDNRKAKSLRLAVQEKYIYEDPLHDWEIEIQYLTEDKDPTSDTPLRWCNYLSIARFAYKKWAIAYADRIEDTSIINFIMESEKE